MKKYLLIIMIAFIGSFAAHAQEKSKNAKHDIAVSGNCEQCKKRIEKAAYSVKGVKSAQWRQDQQDLHLIIDENKCSADDVRKAVAKAGHDTDTVKATKEDYDNLHECCKYQRG